MRKTSPDIKIEDQSGDRKYFTIIPNYILNHSTAIDQALYMQMKRYAGENGVCYLTQNEMCRRLGIGKKALYKSLTYLTEHKWIELIGKTESKTKPINTYRVNDIWKMNTDHYSQKKSSESNLSPTDEKDKSLSELYKSPKRTSVLRTKTKELNNHYNGGKSKLRNLPNLPIPKEQKEYIAEEILKALKDDKSKRYYNLVASKIPESVIRQALSEIKVDGADHPGKVFTHRMETYASQ